MQTANRKRTAHINFVAEPELRDALQREAARRDTSLSSTIRALIRAAFAADRANSCAVGRS